MGASNSSRRRSTSGASSAPATPPPNPYPGRAQRSLASPRRTGGTTQDAPPTSRCPDCQALVIPPQTAGPFRCPCGAVFASTGQILPRRQIVLCIGCSQPTVVPTEPPPEGSAYYCACGQPLVTPRQLMDALGRGGRSGTAAADMTRRLLAAAARAQERPPPPPPRPGLDPSLMRLMPILEFKAASTPRPPPPPPPQELAPLAPPSDDEDEGPPPLGGEAGADEAGNEADAETPPPPPPPPPASPPPPPPATFGPGAEDEDIDEDDDKVCCRVCLGPYEPGESLRMLPCFHRFHRECIDEWFERSKLCPLCNTDIEETISQVNAGFGS
jgi:hypothetical protein